MSDELRYPAPLTPFAELPEPWREALPLRLQQFQKMDSLGRLALGVAHEVNNLLTVIACSTTGLQCRLRLDEDDCEEFQQIRQAVSRAAAIVQQVLRYGRPHQTPVPGVSLHGVVRGLANALRCLTGASLPLEVVTRDEPGLVAVQGGEIEQVLMNLVINACDARPHAGPLTVESSMVELSAEYAHAHGRIPPGTYAVLRVSDRGCGMDATTQRRLFEPFFTTKEPGKGTGLGMAIVWDILARTGGHVTVKSAPGAGSTFEVYWPCLRAA